MNIYEKYFDNTNLASDSALLRKRRFDKFINELKVTSHDKILDVGGVPETWYGTGFESNVTLINLSFNCKLSGLRCVEGNACKMNMFSDKEFDVVFSNSVIEHVGCYDNQVNFSNEVCRVGTRYWIQTPNKLFPVELHFLFPFFQFLPKPAQNFIATRWKYSHVYRNNNGNIKNILNEAESLRLLSKCEMAQLFPDSSIYEEKYFYLHKSIVAFKS